MSGPLVNTITVPVVKPQKPKKGGPVPVGTAYTWFCPKCEGFTITFFEEVVFGEARCSQCTAMAKLDLESPGTCTPKMSAKPKTKGYDKPTAVFEM